MPENHHHPSPLRSLTERLVLTAETVWDRGRALFGQLAPHMDPPPDLEVRSARGAIYSGILVVEHNVVVGGAVRTTTHRELAHPPLPALPGGEPTEFTEPSSPPARRPRKGRR